MAVASELLPLVPAIYSSWRYMMLIEFLSPEVECCLKLCQQVSGSPDTLGIPRGFRWFLTYLIDFMSRRNERNAVPPMMHSYIWRGRNLQGFVEQPVQSQPASTCGLSGAMDASFHERHTNAFYIWGVSPGKSIAIDSASLMGKQCLFCYSRAWGDEDWSQLHGSCSDIVGCSESHSLGRNIGSKRATRLQTLDPDPSCSCAVDSVWWTMSVLPLYAVY